MLEQLLEWARERGYRVAWGPGRLAGEAASEVRGRRARGELDEGFWAEVLVTIAGDRGAVEGTVVVVAVPRPAHRVRFELPDGPFPAVLPPTYVRYRETFEDVRQDLERNGLPGARVDFLPGPLKPLAARLGLVRYGRNNITYAPGLGSFIQLCAFATDAALPEEPGAETRGPALLDECEGCGACLSACPTGAIGDDRVLLSAHRCLTRANEGEGGWPEWAPGWAHACLLGCLACQQACPANPPLTIEETGVTFSAVETRGLLEAAEAGAGSAGSGARIKLAWLGLDYPSAVLGRNLRALLDAQVLRGAGR